MRLTTPMLFAVGFLLIFLLGGITGVMVAVLPFDWQVTDSYFVVAHFHYVLNGAVVFPIFGAIYYWVPKMTGRMLSERLGKLSFWVMFVGFNITFFPMHILGFLGMPRRVYTYRDGLGWEGLNVMVSLGSLVFAPGHRHHPRQLPVEPVAGPAGGRRPVGRRQPGVVDHLAPARLQLRRPSRSWPAPIRCGTRSRCPTPSSGDERGDPRPGAGGRRRQGDAGHQRHRHRVPRATSPSPRRPTCRWWWPSAWPWCSWGCWSTRPRSASSAPPWPWSPLVWWSWRTEEDLA